MATPASWPGCGSHGPRTPGSDSPGPCPRLHRCHSPLLVLAYLLAEPSSQRDPARTQLLRLGARDHPGTMQWPGLETLHAPWDHWACVSEGHWDWDGGADGWRGAAPRRLCGQVVPNAQAALGSPGHQARFTGDFPKVSQNKEDGGAFAARRLASLPVLMGPRQPGADHPPQAGMETPESPPGHQARL